MRLLRADRTVHPAAITALVAAVLAFVFSAYSTYDYVEQLDRQVHAVHCSFIPGAPVSADAENPCKTALFSAYSAIYRATFWGGIPISLFALGAFAFFIGFALYLALSGARVRRRAWPVFAAATVVPAATSIVMFAIAAIHLHAFCKLCVGIYLSSFALVAAAVVGMLRDRRDKREHDDLATAPTVAASMLDRTAPERGWALPFVWFGAFGACALLPALVYIGMLPDYRPLLDKCGTLALSAEHHGLLKLPTAHPLRPVLLFEDPLCPTCKAFHERLVDEQIFDRLDVTLALFPLDSDCNWMLDRSLHPGACALAKAVLCGGNEKARSILEWSYANQEQLTALGKQGGQALFQKIGERWGNDLSACAGSSKATLQLNQQLHYAASAHIPVSTPQMFLGDKRICDEDTDLGLQYTMAQLAPEVLP